MFNNTEAPVFTEDTEPQKNGAASKISISPDKGWLNQAAASIYGKVMERNHENLRNYGSNLGKQDLQDFADSNLDDFVSSIDPDAYFSVLEAEEKREAIKAVLKPRIFPKK